MSVESYRDIRTSLDGLSGRINGEYADADWVPIRYVNQGYPRDQLAGIYRAARIALVTPLRDGMNLVAKEYVAAQDPDDPGVLILSRFAGAAEQIDRGAAGQSLQRGGAFRCDRRGPGHAAHRTHRTLAADDG